MATTDPAIQEPTQPVAPTMPQPEPTFTRDATGAYKFVGQVLLNKPPATQRSFYAVLEENGFEDDILSLWTVDNLETFKYKDPDTNEIKNIRNSDLGKLKMWIAYLEHRVATNNPIITDEEVLDIDPQEFKLWYAQHNSRAAVTTPAPAPSTPTNPTASRVPTTPTDLFKRGIKRDPSLFPVMKQDSQFRQWKLHTISLVKAQDCTEVVDTDYIPRTPDEQA